MKRLLAFILGISLVLAFSAAPAEAKDMSKRIGVGFTAQSGQIIRPLLLVADEEIPIIPSISAKYAITEKLALGGFLGYRSGTIDPDGPGDLEVSMFAFGAKSYYNFITEDNINVYCGGGLSYSSGSLDDSIADEETSISGFDLLFYGGGEFFFQGIPNLGLSLEVGIDIMVWGEIKEENPAGEAKTDLSGFGTYGDILGAIGIHYYF